MQTLIQITEIHPADAYADEVEVGDIFCIIDETISVPSSEGQGFTYFNNLEVVNCEAIIQDTTCFYAIKYKVLKL